MCQECYNTHVCDDGQEEEENAKEDHASEFVFVTLTDSSSSSLSELMPTW